MNEEGEKGKLECFVNFCEETIFEVQTDFAVVFDNIMQLDQQYAAVVLYNCQL